VDTAAWPWFDAVASRLSGIAVVLLVVLNAGFAALVAMRRDRSLVNRWTRPLVVADAALVLVAGGMPVANWMVQRVGGAVMAMLPDVAVNEPAPASVSPGGE
jgi:succinate dehydrogenase hydrophobic anchor subunit